MNVKDLQYGSALVVDVNDHSVTVKDGEDGRELVTVRTSSESVLQIFDKRGSTRANPIARAHEIRTIGMVLHDLEVCRVDDASESAYAIYTAAIALVEAMIALAEER